MLISTLRYLLLGWVEKQLLGPALHFHYYGFSWVQPLPSWGIYMVFFSMILASFGIILGWHYRLFAILFFICFSYIELIDISYYLNHYYFVSIVAFLLILVPANVDFSIDVLRNPKIKKSKINRWFIDIFKLQIAIVYCYAGLAKINPDWLLNALPLGIWLPAKTSIPLIGVFFEYKFTAHAFSWLGMAFDTFVVFGLIWKKTRWFAFIACLLFHSLTGILFQIGVFPLVMIVSVTLFFSAEVHQKLLRALRNLFTLTLNLNPADLRPNELSSKNTPPALIIFLMLFFLVQITFPWRYLCYNSNVFWSEEGYRFSWRVMLMEKSGTANFYVRDGIKGKEGSVINSDFLTPHQEKQMAMQPDLILQFASYLSDHYKKQGFKNPLVRAEVWVTLNGRPSQLLIDPKMDLTTAKDGWNQKDWILPWKDAVNF